VDVTISVSQFGKPLASLEATLDAQVSGTEPLTRIPAPVLQSLGIQPKGRAQFAFGRLCAVGDARIGLGADFAPTLVVFGEPGEDPVLGFVVLETIGLGYDEQTDQLVSKPLRL